MPAFIQVFFSTLAALLPYLVTKVLLALGFGITIFNLGGFAIDSIASSLRSESASLPNEILAVIFYGQVDTAISIILGSYAAVFAFRGLKSGSIKTMGYKG